MLSQKPSSSLPAGQTVLSAPCQEKIQSSHWSFSPQVVSLIKFLYAKNYLYVKRKIILHARRYPYFMHMVFFLCYFHLFCTNSIKTVSRTFSFLRIYSPTLTPCQRSQRLRGHRFFRIYLRETKNFAKPFLLVHMGPSWSCLMKTCQKYRDTVPLSFLHLTDSSSLCLVGSVPYFILTEEEILYLL